MLREEQARLEQHLAQSEFYENEINKDILRVLLSQNGEDDTHDASTALSHAFSAGSEPLIYVVPDEADAFRYHERIGSSLTLFLPKRSETYLEETRAQYRNKTPYGIVEELLFSVGEYRGETEFTPALSFDELQVVKKTEGLHPSFIEILSETSEIPVCYKSYQKALAMAKEQMSDLWNPHLVLTVDQNGLPRVDKGVLLP
jgi:hypothetical protein